MKKALIFLVIASVLMVLNSCDALSSVSNSGSSFKLKNTSWKSEEFKGDKPLTINFNIIKNKVSGFSGCNNYNANYSILGDRFVVNEISSTRKGCEESVESVEREFLKLLRLADRVDVQNNTLLLYQNNLLLLKFTQVIKEK